MTARRHHLPDAQQQALARARWIEVIWLGFAASIIAALYFSLGNSQAMKTAWIEDMLSFVPPLAFLVSTWFEGREPDDRFPLGLIRATSIGYLVSAVALLSVGLFLGIDSGMALIKTEHATIGTVEFFGVTFWFGWVMIAVLVYSAILPVIFGRLKLRVAHQLHDKILLADALMNKADWLTGIAAVGGILGIGMGWWWADAVAALVIALDVLRDGVKHTMAAIRDLSDEMPRTLDDKEMEPLIRKVQDHMTGLNWVEDARLRLRQEGRFLTGTVYVVPRQEHSLTDRVEQAERDLLQLNWRIHDISIMPRSRIGGPPDGRDSSGISPLRAEAVRLERSR